MRFDPLFRRVILLCALTCLPVLGQSEECVLLLQNDGGGVGTDWTNGIVPYRYDAAVSGVQRELFDKAIAEIEGACGLDFVSWTGQANLLTIRPNDGSFCSAANCSVSSALGMAGGEQFISVGSNMWTNTFHLCHEICHALGFIHEQQRPDRQFFVAIVNANISQTQCTGGCAGQFDIFAGAALFGTYDYQSFMHYNDTAFSSNGMPTIVTLNPSFQSIIGQRQYMSVGDAGMLQARYGAPPPPTISSLSPASTLLGIAPITITVTGTRFYDGSPIASGIQGTRVRWNGSLVSGTWISATQFEFVATANMLNSGGCHEVRVENPSPNGGLSNALAFNVIDLTPTIGAQFGLLPDQNLGYAMVSTGDINADGSDDLVVASPGWLSDDGQVTCYSGASSIPLWSRNGTDASRFGIALAIFGDKNGDQINDILVGASGYDGNRGRVQLLDGLTGNPIMTWNGASMNDRFGASVSGLGDANLDGIPDVVVGAPGRTNSTGTAYLFSGSDGALLSTWNGTQAGSQFGFTVASGVDFNGDGRTEIAVGIPFQGATREGGVHLYLSPSYALFQSATGLGAYDDFGTSLALIPSLPVAGGAAILAGAVEPGSVLGVGTGSGYVQVLRVGISSLQAVDTLTGPNIGDRFGRACRTVGDLDQDGFLDFAIGADQTGTIQGGVGAGFVRAYSSRDLSQVAEFSGSSIGGRFGFSIGEARDGDGDGRPDIVVGSPFDDSNCANAGRAQRFSLKVAPSRRKPMITEISSGTPDAVEITNFDDVVRSIQGWRVLWRDGGQLSTAVLSGSLQPGASIVIRDSSGAYPETPSNVQTFTTLSAVATQTGDFVVALTTSGGVPVDEVRVSSTLGSFSEISPGGGFRGFVNRSGVSVNGILERIHGLDSNGPSDWTFESTTSMGLENRSAGPGSADPRPLAVVRITEVDDNPDYIELKNVSGSTLDLQGWFLTASASQGGSEVVLQPFPSSRFVQTGEFIVIGDNATLPPEIPGGVAYINLAGVGGGNIPFTTSEWSLTLHDDIGRTIDVVRSTATTGNVVHNHPRTPSAPLDFWGAAPRMAIGTVAVSRITSMVDSNSGSDWQAVSSRSMGFEAMPGGFLGLPGTGTSSHPFDCRVNATSGGGGLTMILNAGPGLSGADWSFAMSAGHQNGLGSILGLGPDAIDNYLLLSSTPPWFGALDSRGSARLDAPGGTLPPGIDFDLLFVLRVGGAVVALSPIIEFDS